MKIQVRDDIFVRKEKRLGVMCVMVFSSLTSQLYEGNEDIYNIIFLCENGVDYNDLIDELCKIYDKSSKSEIIESVSEIIPYLISIGVLYEI